MATGKGEDAPGMASELTMSIRDQACLRSSLWVCARSRARGSGENTDEAWGSSVDCHGGTRGYRAQHSISGNGIGRLFAPLAIRDLWH
jgi:hypothetical protein